VTKENVTKENVTKERINMTNAPLESILALSTRHLTPLTKLALDCNDVTVPQTYQHGETGWMVAVVHEGSQLLQHDLNACIALAVSLGADWLLFDEGEPLQPSLPAYGVSLPAGSAADLQTRLARHERAYAEHEQAMMAISKAIYAQFLDRNHDRNHDQPLDDTCGFPGVDEKEKAVVADVFFNEASNASLLGLTTYGAQGVSPSRAPTIQDHFIAHPAKNFKAGYGEMGGAHAQPKRGVIASILARLFG